MKRILLQALAVIILAAFVLPPGGFAQGGSPQESVARSTTEFAVDLYRQFVCRAAGQNQNLFFSPYSIYTVLALMYGGAAGETAEQMAAALHVQLDQEDFQAGLADIQDILHQIGERGAVGRLQILVHNGKEKGVEEHTTFIADHPFLFLIKDEPTGSVLFMGRVMDPGEE